MKKSLAFFALLHISFASFAFVYATPLARAAKMADGTAQWVSGSGMSVLFSPQAALSAGDVIVLTFPAEAPVSSNFLFYAPGDDPVKIAGHSFVNFTRNGTDNSVSITVFQSVASGTPLSITLDERVITTYNSSAYAQQSIAINTTSASGAPLDYGVALLTNTNTTEVTATVPLFVTLSTDDVTMDLGTLSVASVQEIAQKYTVNSNNRTGVQVSIAADTPLQDGYGNTIDAVGDGNVTAGQEEYGIALENIAAKLVAVAPFDGGDQSVPQVVAPLVHSDVPLANATFDVRYKAAISGDTVAGSYSQTITVTIATKS